MRTAVFPADDLPDQIPGPLADALSAGVPVPFEDAVFDPLPRVQMRAAGGDVLACFGSCGLRALLGVSTQSGRVLQLVDGSAAPPSFVSTSLGHFAATSRALFDRAPLYGEDEEAEVWWEAAEEFRTVVRGIDLPAADLDTFWDTVCDSISIGGLAGGGRCHDRGLRRQVTFSQRRAICHQRAAARRPRITAG